MEPSGSTSLLSSLLLRFPLLKHSRSRDLPKIRTTYQLHLNAHRHTRTHTGLSTPTYPINISLTTKLIWQTCFSSPFRTVSSLMLFLDKQVFHKPLYNNNNNNNKSNNSKHHTNLHNTLHLSLKCYDTIVALILETWAMLRTQCAVSIQTGMTVFSETHRLNTVLIITKTLIGNTAYISKNRGKLFQTYTST